MTNPQPNTTTRYSISFPVRVRTIKRRFNLAIMFQACYFTSRLCSKKSLVTIFGVCLIESLPRKSSASFQSKYITADLQPESWAEFEQLVGLFSWNIWKSWGYTFQHITVNDVLWKILSERFRGFWKVYLERRYNRKRGSLGAFAESLAAYPGPLCLQWTICSFPSSCGRHVVFLKWLYSQVLPKNSINV